MAVGHDLRLGAEDGGAAVVEVGGADDVGADGGPDSGGHVSLRAGDDSLGPRPAALQVRIVVVCRWGRDACGFVGPAVGLGFGAGAGWGADGFSALSAVVGAVAAVVGGGAGADFPADEACVGSELVPVGALFRWPFVAGHA